MKKQSLNVNRSVTLLDRDVQLFAAGVSLSLNMFRITTENKRGRIILSVEGRLVGAAVQTLEQCWRELSTATPKPKFHVNLCGASFIDNAGKVLLKEMHQQGAALVAEGCLNQAIVREIVGSKGRSSESNEKEKGSTKKPSNIIFYLFFLGLFGSAQFVRAQGPAASAPATRYESARPAQQIAPSGDVIRLSLEQAVVLAVKQNPTQLIGILNAAESVQDRNVSLSNLLPQANLRVADSNNRVNIQAQFGGQRLPGLPQHLGPYQIFSAGPSFSTPIFDFSLWKEYQASRSSVDAAKAGSLSTREQVILLVVSQYIGTLSDVANVEASRSRVELAQALYDQAADLQKEGVGTGIDTLRANVELQNEKQRLIEAENQRDSSLFGLSKLLNIDPHQKIALADSLSYFETPQPDVEASIDLAVADRPEWKQLQAQEKFAKYEKQSIEYSRLPSVRFDGNWDYLGSAINTGIPTYMYEGSLNMPIFTGGRIKAEVVRAGLEIQKVQQQKIDLRNQIALDVKTSLLNLQSARSEVQVANLGIQLAKQEVDQAGDRFRAGVANNIEVISAQDSLSRANDNQIAALYRFNQARADFARAIGQMEKTYAK
jgi:outer membrane protein TolC